MSRSALLSSPEINHKIKKNLKVGYYTYSLNLAHSDISGYNVCPKANRLSRNENNPKKSSCSSVCVAYNGNAQIYAAVMESRINKTLTLFTNNATFYDRLDLEISRAIKKANSLQLTPGFRLNAYSDIRHENYKFPNGQNIFEKYPNVKFYDYTKLANRKVPSNYQLTYSYHGDIEEAHQCLISGTNVAIAFSSIPKEYTIKGNTYNVVDGDETDVRLDEKIDGRSVIVGLKFKGSKKKLKEAIREGFCIQINE
jgi:hypothetical protein